MLDNVKGNLIFEDKVISSQEINNSIGDIISRLVNGYLGDGVLGIFLPREPDLLYCILAALKLNIPFVILDTNAPKERLEYMLSAAKVSAVITKKEYVKKKCFKNNIIIDSDENERLLKSHVVYRNRLAYIVYTSGSSGRPKAVEISREAFLRFEEAFGKYLLPAENNRILCLSASVFDIFLVESILALRIGLDVVLANDIEHINPRDIARLIEKWNVNILQLTPSRLQLLQEYDHNLNSLREVKKVFMGGESLPETALYSLQMKTNAQIYNCYGPSECTIWSTISDLTYKTSIDIGKALSNTNIYIVNDDMKILDINEIGEICISGCSLADGYSGNEKLTNEKFVFLPKVNERVYLTGDLGRINESRDIEYLGRKDNQIKYHGYRIEPEEIETYLCKIEGVSRAIVVKQTYDKREILTAFYKGDNCIDLLTFKKNLKLYLPDYMIPTSYIRVRDFVYTVNGKINRMAADYFEQYDLKPCGINSNEILIDDELYRNIEFVIRSFISDKISSMMENEKDLDQVLAEIDSITFIMLVVELEKLFDVEFDIKMLVRANFPSVGAFYEYIFSLIHSTPKNRL